MTERDELPLVQPIAELFNASVSALWVTTYSLDLALFNEFLLPRLGEPPLNVVVLADHRRLSASLARIPAERVSTLEAVNSRWLLRGVQHGGQAFHPKSYLAVERDRATLLVGSGNLSAGGLDEGREVFTIFRTGTRVGDVAVDAWRRWLRSIVQAVGDLTVAERFKDLEERLPKPPPVAVATDKVLLDNLTQPIARQLVDIVVENTEVPVDELHLAAPFLDSGAVALGQLLSELKPRHVRLYVTESTSVNGQRLVERLVASGAEVTVSAYVPDAFVHAKLVGIVQGRRAWILSGSPNLSQVALTLSSADGGNIELAALAAVDADTARAKFVPPGMTMLARDLEDLASLKFDPEPEPEALPLRLISAVGRPSGVVEVQTKPGGQPGWFLDDLQGRQELVTDSAGHLVTIGALPGRLVQIVDGEGSTISNRVVVDDSDALRSALTAGTRKSDSDLPPELAAGDLDGPLAQALMWLHRNLVMDVTERLAIGTAAAGGSGVSGDDVDDDLWDRLQREQLARDPRASIYRRIWNRDSTDGAEPIILLIEALRARAPAIPETARSGGSLLALLLERESAEGEDKPPSHRWKVATRIRVRARNVIARWAAAQADPRLLWVNPLAPAGNFVMVAVMFVQLRLELARDPNRVELTADDLDDLWLLWLSNFAGTGQGDGWLDQLTPADVAEARQRMAQTLPEIAAALCCLYLRPGSGYRERAVGLQAILTAALDRGLIEPTEQTARYLSAVTGRAMSRDDVDHQLLAAVEFIDDALWCSRTIEALRLTSLRLEAFPAGGLTRVRLDVAGIADPLVDPRVVRLVAGARRYRRSDGIALYASDADWRLVVDTGDAFVYKAHRTSAPLDSTVLVTDDLLQELTNTGGVLASLFPASEEVA